MNAKVKAAKDGDKKIKRLNNSDIQPRRMDFTFDKNMPLYWFDNSQFKTTLLTALSCTFPEGERFFMRAVRNYQPTLRNELLKEEVKGFIGQEAHHGNEHEHFNALMQEKGMPTKKVEDFVRDGIKWQEKRLSNERRLAKTCALEHFTAMLAELMLEEDGFFEGMDERMLPLWIWHAVEESEHKSVAFDVYQEQVGDYWIRASEMAMTTLEFTGFTIFHYFQLRSGMKDKRDWDSIRDGWNWLLGKPGFLRKLGPAYLAYYKRDFHPAKRDKRYLRDSGLKRLAAMLKRPELLEDAA
ncbi:MAG: metal-dependent hydrolase [Pedobacter sp.]|nr:metal-dependent hydrolase [Pedobacter sp.]